MPQGVESTAAMWNSPKGSGPHGRRYLKVAAVLRAAEAMGGATGSPIAPVERANYERMFEELCGRMDDADFAWAKGRAMALVDWTKVVDFALGE